MTVRHRHRLLTLAALAALSGAAFAQAPAPTAGKDALIMVVLLAVAAKADTLVTWAQSAL